MAGFLKWLGPSGLLGLAVLFGVGGWYTVQKGTIAYYKFQTARYEKRAESAEAALEKCRAVAEQIKKDNEAAARKHAGEIEQARADGESAGRRYLERRAERASINEGLRNEIRPLVNTVDDCVASDRMRDIWNRAAAGRH